MNGLPGRIRTAPEADLFARAEQRYEKAAAEARERGERAEALRYGTLAAHVRQRLAEWTDR